MKTVCKPAVYCLITITIVQSVVFLVVTSNWTTIRRVNNEPNTVQLCTVCEVLVPMIDKNGIASQVAKLKEPPNLQCCGGAAEIITLSAQKQTADIFYKRIRYMVPEAVYKMCDSSVDQTPYVRAVGITGFKHVGALYQPLWNQNGQTVTQPSINHITHLQDEGEIFIRLAGLYMISSRLAIQTNASTIDSVFSHSIYVLSHKYGTRRLLGERRTTLFGGDQTVSTFTAVYSLDLHDRLSVGINNPEHIDAQSNNNTFSIHSAG
ncbi:uncharacterized protein LOC127836537 isoform X2 [Dreissena polymorpha]|uniref:THD domain-containing protein n=1 Tax=Dreissena polymorpha TaxID=45954 RepID=A0A9D4JAQ5_DREPO|nr:uncharacterized protein LOC127836537 isoform X2 [Dreissena polymorpha]KAH3804875.1 hypothetical protein DPMN_133167 [Dreissena polymorpha]